DTLRQTLHREVRLPVPRAVAIAADVLDALEHAHAHGIAPRDIKPDNIVLSPPPQGAVLVDLGIARAIASSGDDRVTRSGFVVGTEEYMSPEQAQGVPDVDGRTDLYSLGVVLFEGLEGRPPFPSRIARVANKARSTARTALSCSPKRSRAGWRSGSQTRPVCTTRWRGAVSDCPSVSRSTPRSPSPAGSAPGSW